MYTLETKERLYRVIIFVILNLVLIRYFIGINIDDIAQIKIVLVSVICYMFINTYYPVVVPRGGHNLDKEK